MITKHNNLFVYNTYDEFGLDSYNYIKGNDIIAYIDAIYEVIYWLYFELIWKPLGVQSTNSGYLVNGVSLRKVTLNYSEGSNKYTTLPAIPDEERLGNLTNFLTNYPYIKNIKLNNAINIYNIDNAFKNCTFDIFELNVENVTDANNAFANSVFKEVTFIFNKLNDNLNNVFIDSKFDKVTIQANKEYLVILNSPIINFNHNVEVREDKVINYPIITINSKNINWYYTCNITCNKFICNCNNFTFKINNNELHDEAVINLYINADTVILNSYNYTTSGTNYYFRTCLNIDNINNLIINGSNHFDIYSISYSGYIANVDVISNYLTTLNFNNIKNISINELDNNLPIISGLFIYKDKNIIDDEFVNKHGFIPLAFTDETCTKYVDLDITINKNINGLIITKSIDNVTLRINNNTIDKNIRLYYSPQTNFNLSIIDDRNIIDDYNGYIQICSKINYINCVYLSGFIWYIGDVTDDDMFIDKFKSFDKNKTNVLYTNRFPLTDDTYNTIINHNIKMIINEIIPGKQSILYDLNKLQYKNTFGRYLKGNELNEQLIFDVTDVEFNVKFRQGLHNPYYVTKTDINFRVECVLPIYYSYLYENDITDIQKEFTKNYFFVNRFSTAVLGAPNDYFNIKEIYIDYAHIITKKINTTVTNIITEKLDSYYSRINIKGFQNLTSDCLNNLCTKVINNVTGIANFEIRRQQYNQLTQENINFVLSRNYQFAIEED